MIVEINDILINTDSICTAKRCRHTTDDNALEYCIEMYYNTGKTELLVFKSAEARDVGYHTLRLFETVINKKRKQ